MICASDGRVLVKHAMRLDRREGRHTAVPVPIDSNIAAEYAAILLSIISLRRIIKQYSLSEFALTINSDCESAVRQVSGDAVCLSTKIKALHQKLLSDLASIPNCTKWEVRWVSRSSAPMQEADRLSRGPEYEEWFFNRKGGEVI